MIEPVKRTWCYVQRPSQYEIAPCSCGNTETEWSEWDKQLWCSVCEVDFTPDHWGIFDGPIPINLCYMMGLSFDRINLQTMSLDKFDIEISKYESDK